MIGGDDRGIVPAQGVGGERHRLHVFKIVVAHFVQLRKVRIVVIDACAALLQQLHDFERRRFAQVVHVLFIRDAEDQQLRTVETFFLAVEGVGDGIYHVIGHRSVDFTSQFDEARGEIVFAGLPGKVERINRNAVSAEAGARIERHKPKGLGGGGVNHFPDVNVHARCEQLQFVDQSNVHAAEDVFQQLGHFGRASGTDGNHLGHNLRVNRERRAAAGRIGTADYFGNLGKSILFVAGIFAFGREGQEEIRRNVFAFDSSGDGTAQSALFENGEHQFFGGAWVGRGFQNHQMTLLQMRLNGDGGLFDVAEIGLATLIERSGNTDENGVCFLELGKIGGGAEVAAVDELLDLGLLNVFDVRFAGVEHGNFGGIGIKTGDFVAGFGKAKSQRKSDVTASDNSNF